MKKISIITYSRAYNYGSALQTFALNSYLRKLGNEVKTIDYSTKQQRNLYRIFEPCKGILSVMRNIHSLLNWFKLKRHKKRFDTFLTANIPMTDKINDTLHLESLNNDFDYFICGSDQIWNVKCDDYDPNYMLSFVYDKKKCIAYAPSLGAGADKKETKDAIAKYVTEFKALSCRESKSAAIIESVTHKEVKKVLDPVFLLTSDEWSKVAPEDIIKGEYILGYFIGDIIGMRNYALKLSRQMGIPVVVIYKNLRDLKYKFDNYYEAGPAEFVSLIRNAKCIVTNSFHAISFSIIYKRDFWVFIDQESSDSRITGLLDDVNLRCRIVNNLTMPDMDVSIPYEALDFSVLNEKINVSKKYLMENLY